MKYAVVMMVVASILVAGCGSPALVSAGAGIVGSGKMAERSYPVDGFTGLVVGTAFEAKVIPGDRFLVEVTAEDNLLDYVRVSKEGETLHVGFDTFGLRSFSSHRAEVRITMPELRSVELSGAGKMTIGSGFEQVTRFDVTLDQASQLSGTVQAGELRIDGRAASQVTLDGQASTLALNLKSASKARLAGLAVDKMTTTLDGASSATVGPVKDLDYDLRAASHLQYGGSPAIGQARTAGASSATRR